MSIGRTELNKVEEKMMNRMKKSLTYGIEKLKKRGIRDANIEIQLLWHIRKELKKYKK